MAIIEKILEYLNLAKPNLANLYGLSNVGSGWLFGAFGAVAVSLYSLSAGRTRTVFSLLSIYIAFVFDRLFPYFGYIETAVGDLAEPYQIRIGTFISAYALALAVFNFSFVKKRLSSVDFSLSGVIILTFLQIGFLASIILSFLPESSALRLAGNFYSYFASPPAYFLWAAAPIVSLLFLKK